MPPGRTVRRHISKSDKADHADNPGPGAFDLEAALVERTRYGCPVTIKCASARTGRTTPGHARRTDRDWAAGCRPKEQARLFVWAAERSSWMMVGRGPGPTAVVHQFVVRWVVPTRPP